MNSVIPKQAILPAVKPVRRHMLSFSPPRCPQPQMGWPPAVGRRRKAERNECKRLACGSAPRIRVVLPTKNASAGRGEINAFPQRWVPIGLPHRGQYVGTRIGSRPALRIVSDCRGLQTSRAREGRTMKTLRKAAAVAALFG